MESVLAFVPPALRGAEDGPGGPSVHASGLYVLRTACKRVLALIISSSIAGTPPFFRRIGPFERVRLFELPMQPQPC
jgi:hypothetical protein